VKRGRGKNIGGSGKARRGDEMEGSGGEGKKTNAIVDGK